MPDETILTLNPSLSRIILLSCSGLSIAIVLWLARQKLPNRSRWSVTEIGAVLGARSIDVPFPVLRHKNDAFLAYERGMAAKPVLPARY